MQGCFGESRGKSRGRNVDFYLGSLRRTSQKGLSGGRGVGDDSQKTVAGAGRVLPRFGPPAFPGEPSATWPQGPQDRHNRYRPLRAGNISLPPSLSRPTGNPAVRPPLLVARTPACSCRPDAAAGSTPCGPSPTALPVEHDRV